MDRVVCLESTDGGTQTSALGADCFRQLVPRQKPALTETRERTTHETSNWPSSRVVCVDEVGGALVAAQG